MLRYLPEPAETLYCYWLTFWAFFRRPLAFRKLMKNMKTKP